MNSIKTFSFSAVLAFVLSASVFAVNSYYTVIPTADDVFFDGISSTLTLRNSLSDYPSTITVTSDSPIGIAGGSSSYAFYAFSSSPGNVTVSVVRDDGYTFDPVVIPLVAGSYGGYYSQRPIRSGSNVLNYPGHSLAFFSSGASDGSNWLDIFAGKFVDANIDVPAYSYVDIPAGYVAVMKGRNPSDYSAATFRTTFSWSSSPNQPYWGNTGHSYKFFDSRPSFTGSTLFPLPDSTSFNWLKMGSFGPNGATKGAYYDISLGNTYHWIVIYNPFYTFDSSTSNPKYNSTVRCFAQLAEVYLYPVAQLLDSDGWTGRSLQDWENPYVGVAPEGTSGDGLFSGSEPWTFVQESSDDPGTTVPAVPQPGGDNEAPVQVSLPEIILKFGDLLTGFFDDLLSLFGKGEEAIIALIGIATPFFSLIGMIFTWLPSDIVTFITAAISATVFLGLLKHFL